MSRILLIDDEPAITETLGYALGRSGFETRAARTLAEASAIQAEWTADLIILDLMLPDGNGLDWLRGFRHESQTPVIVLSSHDDTVDRVVGLELGADDYVDKPFSPREIVARVRAVLRRTSPPDTPVGREPTLVIDAEKRAVLARGTALNLSRTEFDLLATFASAPGRVFEREQLLARVWGDGVAVTERTVDVHIKTLRKKLVEVGLSAETIETVRGVGYRLAEDLGS